MPIGDRGRDNTFLSDRLNVFDNIDTQRLFTIPYRQLVARKRCYIDAGLLGDLF